MQKIKFGTLFLSTLTIAVVLSACGSSKQEGNNQDTLESITRGHRVRSSDELGKTVVAIVSDMTSGQALCTGSILNRNLILTAAHCVDDKPTQIRIVFGTDVKRAKPEQVRMATGVLQNPYWKNPNTEMQGDLAIIQFEGDLPSGFFPVHLVDKNYQLSEGQETVFLGYGVTNGQRQTGAGVLRMTSTTVLGQRSDTQVITDGHLTSVCFGDSGGPAFVTEDDEYLQWGVASSVSTQSCNETSIHTALMQYLPWIHNVIRNLSSGGQGRRKDFTGDGLIYRDGFFRE